MFNKREGVPTLPPTLFSLTWLVHNMTSCYSLPSTHRIQVLSRKQEKTWLSESLTYFLNSLLRQIRFDFIEMIQSHQQCFSTKWWRRHGPSRGEGVSAEHQSHLGNVFKLQALRTTYGIHSGVRRRSGGGLPSPLRKSLPEQLTLSDQNESCTSWGRARKNTGEFAALTLVEMSSGH